MSEKSRLRTRRALRVRKRLRGIAGRPRLSVVKSNMHLHVQVIDDLQGKTLVGLGTSSKEMREAGFGRCNKASAKELGTRLAAKAKAANVTKLVLDRGAHSYHGVIAEVAGAMREAGLEL